MFGRVSKSAIPDPDVPVVGIDHVQLAMPPGREGEARAFYADLLGICEVPKPPSLALRGDYDRVYVDDPFGNRLELLERRS